MKRIMLLIFVCFSSFYSIAQDNTNGQDTSLIINYNAKIKWVKDLKNQLASLLSASDNKLFAVSKDGKIFCYDFSGRIIWEHDLKRSIAGRPIDSDGNLVISTLSGDLISLNDSTGESIQSIGLNEPLTSPLVKMSTIYNGNPTEAVILGSSKGSIYCYDINSFEMIWENHSAKGTVMSKPLTLGNKIIFTSGDGYLYCLDSRSGMLIWKWTDPKINNIDIANCAPISDNRDVFICSTNKALYSIDPMLGRTRWKKDFYNCNPPLVISESKKYLYLKSTKNNFTLVSPIDGRSFRKLDMDFGEDTSMSAPIEWKGSILLGTGNGKVYLIENNLKWKPLFYLKGGAIQSITHLVDDTFVVSNDSGRLVEFKLK